jgi:hypothetical protein
MNPFFEAMGRVERSFFEHQVGADVEIVEYGLKRRGLRGSPAEGNKFRSHGNALGDFHADYRFERF